MGKSYEIFRNSTNEIVKTMLNVEWSEVQAEMRNYHGVSARKFSNRHYAYCDCWTSGNPGRGGYKVVTREKAILVERSWNNPHTNNWYELAGIGAGVKYLITKYGGGVLYSDSNICMGWLEKGKVSDKLIKEQPEKAAELNKIIAAINTMNSTLEMKDGTMTVVKKVELRYISGGDNPADDNRRAH